MLPALGNYMKNYHLFLSTQSAGSPEEMAEFTKWWVGSWIGQPAQIYQSRACCTVWESVISGIFFLWVLSALCFSSSCVKTSEKIPKVCGRFGNFSAKTLKFVSDQET